MTASPIAKISAASALVACTMLLRLPPAKKVFFALATTTPVMPPSGPSSSSYSRWTAVAIDERYSSFIVLALEVGSSSVSVTMPSASRS